MNDQRKATERRLETIRRAEKAFSRHLRGDAPRNPDLALEGLDKASDARFDRDFERIMRKWS